ncbi:hypothetical protein VD0004_g9122 [Verticillium dahliae]|uniref:Uncharacterized protein n=1 Tax=Verticillium dahliae TaxID=27337 RepID=A0A444RZ56_VERDA|nr:hypothetical protein VD0004_g9122 [Verticillium dahliae]PNH66453.1 hypothetical protein VD0001_g8151 [Verticillium dahliae]RXG46389.1 hypothetical protein VDGE_05814 [Verticillium dahliae]
MSAQARLCLAGGLRLAGGGLRVRSVQRWGACVPPPAPAVRGSPTVAVGVTSAAATGTYPSVWRPVFRRLVQLFTRPLFPDPSTASASITRTMGADQKRSHGGHSHGHGHHHHHHDNTYLTSSNKNDAGVRITRIGLFSNLGMAFAKGAGGYAFGSQALIADAWHSLTDLASDVLTLATVSWSLKPPTDAFPAGFGKVESLGSLGVSSMLLGGGLFMFWSSLLTLHAHFFLDPAAAADAIAHMHHGHSHGGHGHGHGHAGPSLHAAWLAAGTVAIKEWLYHATMKVARERKSSVLASNAVHHRVDSLTGVVTLAVVLGANILSNAAWLDPVGGLFISLLVVKAGAENTVSALYELADRSIDDDVRASVARHARASLDARGVGRDVEVRDIAGVKSGQNYLVDVELAVPGDWTVDEAREVEAAVRERVGAKVRGVRRVRVRYVPKEAPVAGKFDEYISGEVSQRASPESEDEDEHDHDHDHGHANGNGNGHANGNGHSHANGNGNGNGHAHEKHQ